VDAIKVFTKTLGIYTVDDLRIDSNNTHLHTASGVQSSPLLESDLYDTGPFVSSDDTDPLVSAYVEKLDAKRPALQVRRDTRSR
jgi:hypothetical protein